MMFLRLTLLHKATTTTVLALCPSLRLTFVRVRQDEDNGEVASRPSLPPQRQVTKHIMQT
jgi:isoprenylcysteine carboxyl methyltransferase (ICMT) family protein YpbQ